MRFFRLSSRLCALLPCFVGALWARPSAAEPLGFERYRTPIPGNEAYWHTFASLGLGKGLRFNNPYRLSTPIGDTAESLSWTAAYYDIGIGAVRGPALGLAHGAVLHLSIAAQGISQEVLTPSYVALDRLGDGRFMLLGRAGIPIVLEPDLTGGVELGVGAAYLITAGLGVQSELSGSLFYGAVTQDKSVSTIPVLSAQVGLFIDYEVLP